MNYFSPNQKLVGLTREEANTLRIGLIYVITQGPYGNLLTDPRPLAPEDKKHDEKVRDLAQKMIDELEGILYAFEDEERHKEERINRTSSMGAL